MKQAMMHFVLTLFSVPCMLAQNIVAVEYAIDQDNGFGSNATVNVTPSPDGSFNFSVNTTGLSKGYHTLFLRALDSDGKWSHTSHRTIDVLDDVSNNLVESIEVFNDDLGTGRQFSLPVPQADGSFVVNFPYNQLLAGSVILYARAKDTKGDWSFPAWHPFTIVLQNDPPSSGIEEVGADGFRIYPNPAKERLTLHFDSAPAAAYDVMLTDVSGKMLYARTAQAQQAHIDLNYPPGVYLLRIRSGSQVVSKKITIAD